MEEGRAISDKTYSIGANDVKLDTQRRYAAYMAVEAYVSMVEAARARDRKGECKTPVNDSKIALASKLVRGREASIAEVSEAVRISRATLYRCVESDGTSRKLS